MSARTKSRTRREIKRKKPNLWSLWQKYKQASAQSLNKSINRKFAALEKAVCTQISADAARFSRLGETDEEIFAHLAGLMDVYRRVVELGRGHKFENETVNALIDGICEVLNSRLREFDEAAAGSSANLITAEKRAITDEAEAQASETIEKLKQNFIAGLPDDEVYEWDESLEMILRGDFYEMFTSYRDALKFCLTRLDDLHSREAARLFTELIEREWEELGNIIKVQVIALEDACGTAVPATSDGSNPDTAEATLVVGILDALREAYQQTGPVVEDLQRRLNAPKKSLPSRSFDDFENELLSVLETASSAPPERKRFFAALDAETALQLDSLAVEYKKAAYRLQRVIGGEVLLAEEVTGVFEKILGALPEIPAASDESIERDILEGIRETIEIKIAGLTEAVQTFQTQSGGIIRDFSAEKDAPEDELNAVLDAVRAAWLSAPPEEAAIAAFFDACRTGEAFAFCRERVEKHVGTYMELLEKSTLRFKKEVLLYEVCTFEEILTHSVSRLRDSRDAAVLSAVLLLDDTFRELEIILKKNNIAVIRPAPKEQFNAREHEVLVAEKQDGFEKGEIIKIVTAGYRFKEQVILRANVIAAR